MSQRRGRRGARGENARGEASRSAATTSIEATITELAPGGEGVAIHTKDDERRAVFTPGVLPGEVVRLDADFSSRPARGRLRSVIAASPSRVSPTCAFHAECGACDWMHIARDAQLREHASQIARLLPKALREGRGEAPPAVHPSPKELGYRVRARVHIESRGREVTVGMYARGTRETVAVDRCIVLEPAIEDARNALAGLLAGARGRGEAQIALGPIALPGASPTERGRRAVVDLRFWGELPREVFGRAEALVANGVVAGLRIFDGDVAAPARIGDPTPNLAGADGAPLRIPPGGFSQATEGGNVALASRVSELARALAPAGAPVVELYAGAGNLTVLLASTFDVTAVESDGDACEAARQNLAARGLRAKLVTTDAASFATPTALRGAKLVVLDPPRTGAREAAAALAASSVPAVLYVSCDLPTLARDLETLSAAGFELDEVEGFEMFPQTSHVETVVSLRRAKGGARTRPPRPAS